jgi:hypothetical protein
MTPPDTMPDGERLLLENIGHDIRSLNAKLDAFITCVDKRCSERGAEIAVLLHDMREREKAINRRVALAMLTVSALALILRFAV